VGPCKKCGSSVRGIAHEFIPRAPLTADLLAQHLADHKAANTSKSVRSAEYQRAYRKLAKERKKKG